MLLISPQCETIFHEERRRLHPVGQPVHCMICDHIRTARPSTFGDPQDMPNFVPYLPKIRLPVMAVLICAELITSLLRSRALWPLISLNLTSSFHLIDPLILPPISKTRFFVRLDIDPGAKAEVSVIPISRLIFDQGSIFCHRGKVGN